MHSLALDSALDLLIPFWSANALTHFLELAQSPYRINMPDLTIINNLDEAIHVAFFITAPTNWKNNLPAGRALDDAPANSPAPLPGALGRTCRL
ncbi:hypothetical protein J3R83DRAFT_5749 [Lanmaoa asiatica]|nr:hypothetical protein J3R83DRAFT_5749 [Lanmaoa asiatica]